MRRARRRRGAVSETAAAPPANEARRGQRGALDRARVQPTAGWAAALDVALVGRPLCHFGGGAGLARDGTTHAQKNALKPWLKEALCIPPEHNAEFVAAMEDVLAVYARPYDPQRPLLGMDETSKQLVKETRVAQPAQPGRAA